MSLPLLEISDSALTPLSETRSFAGKYESLAKIGDFVRSIARQAGLQDSAVYAVEMAVDEACSNVIEHAYGGEGNGEIRCTCRSNADGLTIVLEDDGRSFDPSSIKAPNLSASLEERESHGLGLFFIRQYMDRVDFEFGTGRGNRLTMFKSRRQKARKERKH